MMRTCYRWEEKPDTEELERSEGSGGGVESDEKASQLKVLLPTG